MVQQSCCRTCRPYSGVAKPCRVASINQGYIDETALGRNACHRRRCACRCKQIQRCTRAQPREWFKLDIPRLALNGPEVPAALTRSVPCASARFAFESGAAALNTVYPARYETAAERECRLRPSLCTRSNIK